ncbi:MAG: leucine-rich repeat protein, partial [Lachnospiraceae bacterium]|nr:leucine-rich repeat protein [Lachnospiraceae bacterium]
MNPEYGSKEQDLSATIGNTERGKRVMKRGRRFLAFLLAALLAAGSLQAPAISLMTAVPVFAADAAEAETAGTDADANTNADQDLGKTSSREDEENASAVGDSSLTDTADETAADSADANEETSGQEPAEPTEEEWQEDEPAEADPAAGETQEDGFEMETGQEQEAESALSDEGRNGGETQTTEPAETSVNDTENGTVSDDLSAAQEAASETGTELTPEQICAFQEKVRIWKDGNRISMVYASTEDIRLAYSIYPGVEDLAETLDDPLYSGVLGWDDESGLYYEAVDFDAVNEADAGRDLPQIDIRDIPVCVVIEDGRNRYVESVGAAPGGVEIESAELNDGNIDIAWDGGDADGYAVIVRGSGIDIYDSTSTEISVSASESEEYVIEVSAYAYDENAGIMQFGEAGSRELMLPEGLQNETNDETPTPDDAQTAPAGESENTDEAASKGPEEQEKVLTEPGNRETVSSDAMIDAVESGTCGENLTWTLDSDGVLTISGTGKMGDYSYNSSPWYSSRSSIKTVAIQKGVTTIGKYAFIYCSSLENITIPEGVTSIGRSAFESCTRLKEITIPEGVTSIGTCAFYYCIEMKEIALPQSLLSIGDQAFYNVPGPSSIDLPEGLTTIGYDAFAYMSGLEEVSVPDSVVTLGSSVFSSCRRLKSVALGKGITVLPVYAFYRDSALEKVILPQKLEHIGAQAFYSCSSLSQIAIPDSVKVIGNYAFKFCTSLTEISLPASLEALGEGAFYGCTNLRTVILPDRVFEAGENVFEGCADALQFQDRKSQILTDVMVGEESPAVSSNRNNQNYSVQYAPRYSYLINEGGRRLRVEYTDGVLTREYFSEEGNLLSRKSIPFELSEFGGFFAGEDSYFVVFGQNNDEEDDEKEVIRIVKYSREWARQGAASIRGENTTVPFRAGTVSLTETGGMLYMRTSHQMYTSLSDGLRHQANLTAVIREADMTVSWILSGVRSVSSGYVSHSFNQIVKTDGADLLAADHGDAYPRGIVLFRYAGKAGAEKLDYSQYVIVLPIAGKTGANATGASLGALEASSSHYLVAGNSVSQDEDSYNTSGVRNIFVTATPKDDFTSSATEIRWLTSYSGNEKVSTPVMTALPDGRFLLMWTVDEVLNYCFLAADGSQDGPIYTGEGSISDCEPYVKDNAVWWYVTKSSAPVYYSISLKAPYEVRIQNPGHTVVFDPAGGKLEKSEMEVAHWGKYGELPIPEREAGYEFLGWFTGKNIGTQVTASSDVRVRPSETLYARWMHHWSFEEETGTLRILKAGVMKDYSSEWSELKDRVKRVVIEPGVTSICYNAFNGFPSLESVSISDSVTNIGSSAFKYCSSLKSITIPDSVTEIWDNAFQGCTALESITIP